MGTVTIKDSTYTCPQCGQALVEIYRDKSTGKHVVLACNTDDCDVESVTLVLRVGEL